ncbi:adenylosuccinate lyase family protein [Streptomyces sp. 5-10]|uniref:class-II fumarase/aspartase family protein n=1 Tax=Streptomyces sp. 5-10 TaxID=878925 RepID=UPI00168B0CF8|nr:adenylosuccinate lyase family protein [Streptomyces sp. 5-10]MBD3005206.1 adenylosuccinate lyase family protein [Streptomyces sp. 5-10]
MTDTASDTTDGAPRHADVGLLSPVRAGTPAETTTSDGAWLQAMLDAEAGLVRAQARLGLVPEAAARTITDLARAEHLDVVEIARLARGAANPVVALVRAFTALVAAADPAAAEYVHRGSTSQDIMDTAAMLVAHRTLVPLVADLERIARALRELAVAHRDTLMPGRTLALHAVPTTFGLKAAGWLSGVAEAAAGLARIRDHGLPVQLGGAAGTLAGYTEYALMDRGTRPGAPGPGEFAERLMAEFAAQVGLNEPDLPWHTARTPVAGLAAQLALAAGALGKVAVDVQLLSRTETAEVAEPAAEGRGVSSAMPHKRNPALATLVRSAALQVPALASAVMGCMLAEDERPAGAWHAEWLPLRECLRLTGGAAHTAVELVEGLDVFPDRMRVNLGLTGGLIVSERLAAALTPVLGKGPAKELMSRASAEAAAGGRTLGEVLTAAPELAGHFTAEELAALLDPANYPGAAGPLVDRAVREHRDRF